MRYIPLLLLAGGCIAPQRYDIVVYGGTSAGVVAAVTAARLGRSVVLVEPSQHLGGMTASGLGATDFGNIAAIGGLAREFYRRVGAAYGQPEAFRFEPHVAEAVFDDLGREAGVTVVLGERLDRRPPRSRFRPKPGVTYMLARSRRVRGVEMRGARITEIAMESGRRFCGGVFIDATYEGDLLAGAGVGYRVGREANREHGETLNGVQVAQATHHQFTHDVDPYVVPDEPASGLLPGIEPEPPPADGSGDGRVQAYNYRLCTTNVPENRRLWPRPADYDERRYELLLRNFAAGDRRVPWHPVPMPNHKTDTNNNHAISTDCIGMNYVYPDADYAARARIVAEHKSYTQGLLWTLANHPRVPEEIRRQFQEWGLARDEFVDNDNWPYQLYVREARRMVSDVVMTQHHCQGHVVADDSVGLAAYGMDSHNVLRYVDAAGHVRNEGDVQVGGFAPYPISYRAIVPRRSECTNLLVPVCVSATHIAYGSIRMEPVFMVLGQSAATAAALTLEREAAPDGSRTAQDIPYPLLAERLRAAGQILEWKPAG